MGDRIWIVAWVGYEDYGIEKVFRTQAQAEAFVANRRYWIEEWEHDGDHYWSARCNDNWIRACCDTEVEAQRAIDDHQESGSPHGMYFVHEHEVEP